MSSTAEPTPSTWRTWADWWAGPRVLAAFFSAAVLASVALPGPGLLNFWGEFAIFLALWDYHAPFVVMAALGLIISAVYGLRAIARIFFGPPSEAFADYQKSNAVKDITTAEKLPALLLLAALILTGLWPRIFTDDMNRTLEDNYSLVTRSLEKGSILNGTKLSAFVEEYNMDASRGHAVEK